MDPIPLRQVALLGAVAELDRPPSGISFEEFVEFDDGSRVIWSDDRGCGLSFNEHHRINGRDITRQMIVVLDVDAPNTYPDIVLRALYRMGLRADPLTAYCAPFRIEFGPQLRTSLPGLIEGDWDRLPPAGIHLWGRWKRSPDGSGIIESLQPDRTHTEKQLHVQEPSEQSNAAALEAIDPNWSHGQ